MQFDEATSNAECWASSYERIKQSYAKAGYEMPSIVYWNLASTNYGNVPVQAPLTGFSVVGGLGAVRSR